MRLRMTWFATLMALVFMSTAAYADCGSCGGDKADGACVWMNKMVDFSLAEEGDKLLLASVVNGCPGKRARHQDKFEADIAKGKTGTCCPSCPFALKDLAFEFTRTELGATVAITGPADKRAEFKKLYEAKIAARATAGDTGGCGCDKTKATCAGCDKAKADCDCKKDKAATCAGCDKAKADCDCKKDKAATCAGCGKAKADCDCKKGG
jgi:hypothetical protein